MRLGQTPVRFFLHSRPFILLASLGIIVLLGAAATQIVIRSTHLPPTDSKTADAPDGSRAQAQPVPESLSEQGSDPPGAKAKEAALRSERMERGNKPVNEQIEMAAEANGVRPRDVRDQGVLVVTLKHPLPLDVFEKHKASGRIPNFVQSATMYVELADGYPFKVSGPLDAELVNNLSSMMDVMAEREGREQPPGPQTASGVTAEQDKNNTNKQSSRGERIESARQELDERAVVLGFKTRLTDVEHKVRVLKEHYELAAMEALLANEEPLKGSRGPIDRVKVQDLRTYYKN